MEKPLNLPVSGETGFCLLLTQKCLLKALKQCKKAENDMSSILQKFSRWVPLKFATLSLFLP